MQCLAVGRTALALTGVAIVATVGACSGPPPTGPSDAALAVHFDSLAGVALSSRSSDRFAALLTIANALAHGARPVPVAITIGGVPKRFLAVAMDLEENPNVGFTRRSFFAAWADPNGLTMVEDQADSSPGPGFYHYPTAYIRSDSSEESGAGYAASFSLGGFSSPCANTPIVYEEAPPNSPCALGATQWSFTGTPSAATGPDSLLPAGTVITMHLSQIPTVHFGAP